MFKLFTTYERAAVKRFSAVVACMVGSLASQCITEDGIQLPEHDVKWLLVLKNYKTKAQERDARSGSCSDWSVGSISQRHFL